MKKIAAILFSILISSLAIAQTAGTATQRLNLNLTNVLEIAFVTTGNNVGTVANLNFSSVNDYADGIESPDYQVRVRSNKKFDVRMEASDDYFTYAGTATPTPQMRVKDVLDMMITANNTGGQINSGYQKYKHIDGDNDKRVLNDCDLGNNQTFSVKYRATPGYDYPAGTYTTNIVYTVTQN